MEHTPSLPVVAAAETATTDKDNKTEKKDKKDKAGNLGSLIIKPEATPPPPTLLERLNAKGDTAKASKAEKPAAEVSKELIGEELAPVEAKEVVTALAEDRANQLAAETPADAEAEAANRAAAHFIEQVRAQGDIEDAVQYTADELALEVEVEPTANPGAVKATAQPAEEVTEALINPQQVGQQGELPLHRPAPAAQPSPNLAPATYTATEALAVRRQGENDGLLVGAIVGYLYGRRRGRKKAEKRLAPVQRKLERQVKHLQNKLSDSEDLVRQAAVRRYRQVEAIAPLPTLMKAEQSSATSLPQPERLPTQTPIGRPLERIGHVVVAAESSQRVERPASPTNQNKVKQAETMTRAELLGVSERIVIDGASLRQVYENNLLTEKGLRRLVAEHLRGGNVKRALRRELIEREIDFERDPQLRDKARSAMTGGGKSALDQLLVRADAPPPADGADQSATQTSKPVAAKTKTKTKQPSQNLFDGLLITIILVLVLIISWLLLR